MNFHDIYQARTYVILIRIYSIFGRQKLRVAYARNTKKIRLRVTPAGAGNSRLNEFGHPEICYIQYKPLRHTKPHLYNVEFSS